MTLSAVLAVFNEESNLERCLSAVKPYVDEIVIVDGGSNDKTIDIAKKFNAVIIQTDNPKIFHVNKQKALDCSSGDWILQLDADEVVTPELMEEIRKTIQASDFQGFYLKRRNFFLGQWLKKGGQYPDPVIRLLKRGLGKFPCLSVHEQIEINGVVGKLKNDLLHFTAPTFQKYLTNSNRYTQLAAEEYARSNVGMGVLAKISFLLIKPLAVFFKIYLRHKGFMDGFPGFVFAFYSGLHIFTSFVKYWEIRRLEIK